MAKLAGINQLDWQYELMHDWSARNEHGKFIHSRCGASIPRQAGKSVDGILWSVFLLSVLGYSVLWTDHNYSTTCEMLRRFQEVFGKKPNDPNAKHKQFNDLVERVNLKTAQEAIFLKNGGLICFSTRTKSAALGYSFDVVFYDEAQELTDEQMQAILPTTTSGPHKNMQAIFLGTPTRAGNPARVFSDMREEAMHGNSDDMCWIEYGVNEIGDVHDEERWAAANPSFYDLATVPAIRAAAHSLSELAFAQEYLGYWLPKVATALISKKEWELCQVEKSPDEGTVAYGVKFSFDGEHVALAAALLNEESVHVEIVKIEKTSRGTGWLANWLLERIDEAACVAIDGLYGAGMLKERLIDAEVPKGYSIAPNAGEVITSASMMLEAIQTKTVSHIGQPALDVSALNASKRNIGKNGGWGWGGEESYPMEAASLALWAVKTTKRELNTSQEAWF